MIVSERRRSPVSGWLQAYLLAFPIGLLIVGLVLLATARSQEIGWETISGAVLFAAVLVGAHVWVRKRLPNSDPLLLPIAACLAAVGQLMTSRLDPTLGPRQGIWVLLGLGLLVGISLLPSASWLRRYRYTWAALAIALLLATVVFGVDPNGSGAALWFVIGPVNFQPTEIVKLLLVVFLAAYLDEYRELIGGAGKQIGPLWIPPLPYLAPILLMSGLAVAVLVVQRDLGPALLFTGTLLTMLYMASSRMSYVVLGLGLLLIGGIAADRAFELVHTRVVIWLDPWAHADTGGYQIVQALYALGSGGIFGQGLGFGSPRYIPAVVTDFVIAAIGEEMGLLGSLGVIGLFVAFTARGYRVAMRARSAFSMLLAAGLTTVFALQALIILAGALKLIPLTGITLPFVSYGGSSVVANFLLLGALLLISHEEESRIRTASS